MKIKHLKDKTVFDVSDEKWMLIQKRGLAHKYKIVTDPPAPEIKEVALHSVKPAVKSPRIELQDILATLTPEEKTEPVRRKRKDISEILNTEDE